MRLFIRILSLFARAVNLSRSLLFSRVRPSTSCFTTVTKMFSLLTAAFLVSTASSLPQWGWPGHHKPPHSPGHGHGTPLSTTVDLGYSTYEGTRLEPANILQYLGIRFAAAPLGDLRWRAPQDPVHTTSIQPADAFQPTCLGYFGGGLSASVNEDCLFLNVFAPANATTESKLPVWFFIQGGGYAGDTDQNFNFTEVVERSGYGMVAVQVSWRQDNIWWWWEGG